MKRMLLVLTFFAAGTILFAQVNLPEYRFASGNWAIASQRLYQNDTRARLAKMNVKIPQSGAMLYEFDARYEGGAEDGHGGFGLHIFMDAPYNGVSWGAGSSYLLWLNYDEKPANKKIQPGLSAQIYRSYTNSRMELVQSYDMNHYMDLLTKENLSQPVHFKILADGNTGEIRVYDPLEPGDSVYYVLYLDKKALPLKGNWIALRTNGMKMSFTN